MNAMNTLDYTTSPASLPGMLAHVASTQEPVIITQAGQPPVVMLSLDEYESLQETLYLLGNPVNARHLLTSLEQFRAGQVHARELAG